MVFTNSSSSGVSTCQVSVHRRSSAFSSQRQYARRLLRWPHLFDSCRQGRFQKEQRVLFLHTGGAPALFAYDDVMLGRRQVVP
jgi:hypothetical protein